MLSKNYYVDVRKHSVQVLMGSPNNFLEPLLVLKKSDVEHDTEIDVKFLFSFIELFLLQCVDEQK
jgi:hypothetical protein